VDFDSITIRRSLGGYPSSPTDGTPVAAGLTGTTFTDDGLATGTYYYSLFAKTSTGDYSIPAYASDLVGRNACLLEGYWKFDATTTSPIDATGNSTSGTGFDVALSEDVPSTGFTDPYSYSFNGTTSRIDVPRPVANDFSICAWIKTTAQGAGNGTQHYLGRAIAHAEAGGIDDDFGFGMDANERLTFGVGGGADYGVHGATAINTGDWTHVCATRQRENGAIKLYVDGVQDGSGTGSTATLNANPTLTIGFGTDGALHWNGLIDDVRAYDYALYPDEVADLSNGVNACFGAAAARSGSSGGSDDDQEPAQSHGGSRRGAGAPPASSGSRSSSSHAAAPRTEAASPLRERTCARVAKRFAADRGAMERLNARLLKRFGFACQA
jgi:hypothetical protein